MPLKDLSNWRFENEFKISSSAMYIIRTHPFIPRDRVWLTQFLGLTFVNACCLFLLTNSIFGHDAKAGNYADASKNFAMLIICFNSNIKYYTMLYYQESIAGLIKTIDRDYELGKEFPEEELNIILKYSKKANKVCKFWIFVAFFTSSIFPVKAFYLMTYYYFKGDFELVPMFDMTFPFFIERFKTVPWVFFGIFCLCFFFDSYAFLVYLGFEPLIPIFTLHVCGQLELLSLKISKLISESETEQEMKDKIRKIIVKLQELHRYDSLEEKYLIGHHTFEAYYTVLQWFCCLRYDNDFGFIDEVQNNFMLLMEFNMKTTTFILPCNAFQIVQEFRINGNISIEFISLLLACIIHFLTPCYFSDILMESSESFRQAVYCCGWEKCRHLSIRKMVLLMLTRAGKPFSISTVFYFISLDTFSTMCRQAYAIFNVMTAAWT